MESTGADRLSTSLPDELFDEETELEVVDGELVPRPARQRVANPGTDRD